MGDDLARILFEALHAARQLPSEARRPKWDDLPLKDRGCWEAVATKARQELDARFRRDIRDAVAAHGAEQTIANLLADGAS